MGLPQPLVVKYDSQLTYLFLGLYHLWNASSILKGVGKAHFGNKSTIIFARGSFFWWRTTAVLIIVDHGQTLGRAFAVLRRVHLDQTSWPAGRCVAVTRDLHASFCITV